MLPSSFVPLAIAVAVLLAAARASSAFAPSAAGLRRTSIGGRRLPPANLIPITKQETLNQEQGKKAGIGGLAGPTPPKWGGLGSVGVSAKGTGAQKKKPAAKPAAKAKGWGWGAQKKTAPTPAAKGRPAKGAGGDKKVDLFTKMPWQK